MTEVPSRGMSLHTKILLGLLLGAAAGVTVNVLTESGRLDPARVRPVLTYVTEPVGKVFLRMLLMTVVPLVFASLAVGVAQLGDLRRLGRIGVRTFAYFVATMTLAVTIGLVLVNTVRPGAGLSEEKRAELIRTSQSGQDAEKKARPAEFGVDTFVNIVPRNPLAAAVEMDMLGIIFFALLVGIGLTLIDQARAQILVQALEGISDLMVFIINLAMRLAPYGVFALIFTTAARLGIDFLIQLGLYVVIVIVGLAIQMFGVLSVLVRVLSGLSPVEFFRRVRAVIVTAFSTSSSNATLPTSLKVTEEELGVPPQIAGFVLPLGATMNMNGTALFEGVTAVFLAQVYGVELGLGAQLIIVVMAVITAIGAAGVPGGSIPLLAMVITSVGVPAEGIFLILGVDRLLDMCRTTLNVVGDITAATYVARSEGFPLVPPQAKDMTATDPKH